MARPIKWEGERKEAAIEEIFERIYNGESSRAILVDEKRDKDKLPSHRVFIEWLSKDNALSKQYAHMCEARAERMFEDIINIADGNGKDVRVNEFGDEVTDHDVIQRAKLRVDARKWVVAKMQPKKYGDKLDLTTGGDKMNTQKVSIIFGDEKQEDEPQ